MESEEEHLKGGEGGESGLVGASYLGVGGADVDKSIGEGSGMERSVANIKAKNTRDMRANIRRGRRKAAIFESRARRTKGFRAWDLFMKGGCLRYFVIGRLLSRPCGLVVGGRYLRCGIYSCMLSLTIISLELWYYTMLVTI